MANEKEKWQYMIVSGYTVVNYQIRDFKQGVEEIRRLAKWMSPEPILVKVVAYGKEIL